MIKHLITGGCSFSHSQCPSDNWLEPLVDWLREKNPKLTYEHTGYLSNGQELIQKKVTLSISEALESGLNPDEILVVVMWSGTFRKAWYIDNPFVMNEMIKEWSKFVGGMSSQFLDLKNKIGDNPDYFYTENGSKFEYNPNGGWYFTVNGSDCKLNFIQSHYILDGDMYNGIGKIHSSLENIVMLQNYCKIKNVKLVNQFFMDNVFEDVEKHKEHQLINYLYKQLNFDDMIVEGMFEYLHTLLGIERKDSIQITHEGRLELDKDTKYFNKDGFHPGRKGADFWCQNILFPFLNKKIS
jgi:hypothetical protein